MAVIDNVTTSEGDILIIKPEIPAIGLISLLSFSDETTGETPTDKFNKEFRYSINGGLVFSEWIELNTPNITNITITQYDAFVIELRYIRVGSNGNVSFQNATFDGEVDKLEYPVYNKTPFAKFFDINDIEVFNWSINVLEKIYGDGHIAKYLTRRLDNKVGTDQDYITFWGTITKFFAILVVMARQFLKNRINPIILRDLILSSGLHICEDSGLDGLSYLIENSYAEYRKRGTRLIYQRKDDNTPVDGELLRLLCNRITDEFIFALTQRGEIGWCVGNSSPLYTGTNNIINVIKGYEFTEAVEDLSKYPLTNPAYISIEEKNSIDTIKLSPNFVETGIGNSSEFATKSIIVDNSIDYEISFKVISESISSDLCFGIIGFDAFNNVSNLLSAKDINFNNFFFLHQALPISDNTYWIRGILYNKDKTADANDQLAAGFGNNLRMTNSITKIMPVISASISTKWIYDIKVRPLDLPISRGVLGANNLTFCWFKNNSSNNDTITKRTIESELVPYNQFLNIKWL